VKRTLKSILQHSKGTSAANGGSPGEVLPPKAIQKFVGGDFKEVGGFVTRLSG
jgi:hypothetical protein